MRLIGVQARPANRVHMDLFSNNMPQPARGSEFDAEAHAAAKL